MRGKPNDIRFVLEHPVCLEIDGEELAKFYRFAIEFAKIDKFLKGTHTVKIVKYDRPYSVEEIRKNYSTIADKLLSDPLHKWRAETGIELIHKEPSIEELDRVWFNWNAMSDDMKRKSDAKSLELFGITNEQTYLKFRGNVSNVYSENSLAKLKNYKTALALEQDA